MDPVKAFADLDDPATRAVCRDWLTDAGRDDEAALLATDAPAVWAVGRVWDALERDAWLVPLEVQVLGYGYRYAEALYNGYLFAHSWCERLDGAGGGRLAAHLRRVIRDQPCPHGVEATNALIWRALAGTLQRHLPPYLRLRRRDAEVLLDPDWAALDADIEKGAVRRKYATDRAGGLTPPKNRNGVGLCLLVEDLRTDQARLFTWDGSAWVLRWNDDRRDNL